MGGELLMPYETLYYDTADCEMYLSHLHGKLSRKKIRERRYLNSGTEYLEIKIKNNKGRTDKQRIATADLSASQRRIFIKERGGYDESALEPKLENSFRRLTLVNNQMTERLTIDTSLIVKNIIEGTSCDLSGIVIIELKRDGRYSSPVSTILRRLHIHPSGFSKYCMGMAFTNTRVPHNRFKPRMRMIEKLITK